VDIKEKAARLGALLVKIDEVKVPSASAKPSAPQVILVGRAYRPLTAAERKAAHRASARPATSL
jgi:hypothetical protein